MAKPKPTPTQILERFWSKVDKCGPIHPTLHTPCWLWKGTLSNNGYGVFSFHRKNIGPHRFAYEITFGKLTSSRILVCHKCDNPLCCNPNHLFAGSHSDNHWDAVNKGLWRSPQARPGERNPAAKLTEDEVREIRRLLSENMRHKEIALRYCISVATVRDISYHITWKHI